MGRRRHNPDNGTAPSIAREATPLRPNIVYLHSHDTGRFIQPYGHAVETPALMRLARQGVLFRQAFCANPTCSASRAALLTGMAPHNNGMIGLAHRGFRLHDYRQHIVHTLRGAGYFTVLAGQQHVIDEGAGDAWRRIGYDAGIGNTKNAHERAEKFLLGAPRQPFFLDVGFFETHREFPAETPLDDPNYCLPPAPLPDTPETRRDMAQFKASARILDAKMGRVLDALDQSGLAENTLVICTTDHGIAFPRMKCHLTDSGIGVMLLMRGPGGFEGGHACDALVSHVDIFPTVCDLLRIERPAWLQGVSMLPLVRGEREEVREEVFAEVNYHAAYEPMRAVRTRRWKYIRRYDDRRSPVLPNCDDSPSKDVWLANGWQNLAPEREALYDLVFDPNETCNLAGAPRAAEALADMRGRLERWMYKTDDPLLRGPIPAPEGAQVNDPDGMSPREPMTVVSHQ
jgi:arylsulfatase A-like enzyme